MNSFAFIRYIALVYVLMALSVIVGPAAAQVQEGPLRNAFVEMTPWERTNIQTALQAHGYYDAPIDGLWGESTEAAVRRVFDAQRGAEFSGIDIETRDGAERFFDIFIATFVGEGSECDGCEAAGEAIVNEEHSPSTDQIAELEGRCIGYVSFSGLCWALEVPEMISILESRGFSCEQQNCGRSSDNARIWISADELRYNCVNFNACNYSIQQLAQMILDEGILPQMQSNSRVAKISVWRGYSYETITNICGGATDGQVVCVDDEYGGSSLLLARGTFGQDGVNFN